MPAQIPGKLNAKGQWEAQFALTPTNAPCYIDITATAADGTAAQTSQPIRIYVKKR